MKVVFVGPSLPNANDLSGHPIEIRPPAVQGDMLRAVRDGATVIGLIDGGFEYTAPVWHKEILYALSRRVAVVGAASMGALRAAECQAFGMVGVGGIFNDYASGELVDDAEVALLHGPMEYGFRPITLPMVNIRATVKALENRQTFTAAEAYELETIAGTLFYKLRTWTGLHNHCEKLGHAEAKKRFEVCQDQYVDQKRLDALTLLEVVRDTEQGACVPWSFQSTSLWRD
ncbi:antibiotic resistance protein [Rhizobium sp. Leaf306]|uniref:TfuA-like protein n=1 Tax=Rhizobium sp. Leaf306 TaxID=1736330 RepID=UPI0007161A53|nr:TfuA-like protein [Rhizobium sp. Leaf306]KQQ38785.1 antibiotic resistance protein [Rhizobium sp. Leaf306]